MSWPKIILTCALASMFLSGVMSAQARKARPAKPPDPKVTPVTIKIPSAEDILDRFVEVSGGKAAFDKITSETIEGSMTMAEIGLSGTMKRYAAPPNFEYMVAEFGPIGKIESGVYNGIAWEKNAISGARVKTGDEKDQALRSAEFNSSAQWRKLFPKVELTGSETVEGEECDKLLLTPQSGRTETQYFSKRTGLLMKTVMTATSPMGEVEAEAVVLEYRNFNGIMVPARSREKAGPASVELNIHSVRVNEPIPPSQFEPPAEVKVLIQ